MSYYELFQLGPAVYIPVLLLSLVITIFVYGAFPFIFSKTRKTPITKRKYKSLCYGLNIIGLVVFLVLTDEASAGAYFLWTWIFSNYGVKTLTARGIIKGNELQASAPNSEPGNYLCEKKEDFDETIQYPHKLDVAKTENSYIPLVDVVNYAPDDSDFYISAYNSPKNKANKKPIIITIIAVFAVALVVGVVAICLGGNNKKEIYNVSIRTITFSDEFTAEYVFSAWENGKRTEKSLVELMNKYGAEQGDQGAGRLYLLTPGEYVEEFDEWCFSPKRKIGDCAIIENVYGFSICYISDINSHSDYYIDATGDNF